MTINFYLDKRGNKSEKKILCYVRANNKLLKFPTKMKIDVKYWDINNQRAKKSRDKRLQSKFNSLNSYLGKFEDMIKSVEEQLQGNEVTNIIYFDELKQAILESFKPTPKGKTFFEVFEEYLKDTKYRTKNNSAVKKYSRLREILTEFEKFNAIEIAFENINHTFLDAFLPFLNCEIGMQDNTAYQQVSMLKGFMKWATLREYNTNIKYEMFKTKKRKTTIVTLSTAEIRKLYDYDFQNKRLEKVRDAFVFQC